MGTNLNYNLTIRILSAKQTSLHFNALLINVHSAVVLLLQPLLCYILDKYLLSTVVKLLSFLSHWKCLVSTRLWDQRRCFGARLLPNCHNYRRTIVLINNQVLLFNSTRVLTIFQVKKAGLAHVLHPCTTLANFRLLEAHPRTRTPSEDSEWARTRLTLLAISVFSLQIQAAICTQSHGILCVSIIK